MAPPLVILDTCVLLPIVKRTVLLTLAEVGCFQPQWSAAAVREFRTHQTKLKQVSNWVPTGEAPLCVEEDIRLTDGVKMKDPADRHLIAACLTCDASTIVTDNVRDFPKSEMKRLKISIITADEFVFNHLKDQPDFQRRVSTALLSFLKPDLSFQDLLRRSRLPRTAKLFATLKD